MQRDPMKDNSAYFPSTPTGFQELPIVLLFSLCLAGAVVATSALPLRFALASSAGIALVGASCFVQDKRMFYVTLLTLAIVLTTSKRLILTGPMGSDDVDSISISLTDVFSADLLCHLVLLFPERCSLPSIFAPDSDRSVPWALCRLLVLFREFVRCHPRRLRAGPHGQDIGAVYISGL